MHELTGTLLEKGHNVEIFAQGDTTRTCNKNGARINRFSTIAVPLIRILDLSRKISKHLENKDFDVYHVNAAPLAFFMEKEPLVVTAHSTLFGKGKSIEMLVGRSIFDSVASFYYKQTRFLEKRVYDKAKIVIAVNDSIRVELERIYKISKEKIATIYNGVDTEIFYAMRNKAKMKEELGLGPQGFTVLYVGRLAAIKNIDLLIKAMYLLREENIVTLIIGKGPKENALKRLVKNCGLDIKVNFVGYVENRDLVKMYNAADVFVLPSIYEGTPLALLEAMACGVPTIATNFQGIKNIVQNGENGMILQEPSAELLADKIAYLHREPEVLRSMSMKAIRVIEDRFSWHKTVEEIIDIYRHL